MWTSMIARVRGVIAASTPSAVMFQVAGSQSTPTGTRPARTRAAAQLMIVKVGMTTSEPFSSPSAWTAMSSATEPLVTAMPCRRPATAAIDCSKRLMNGPSDEIHPVRMHSAR